ncbi:DNA polymerase III, subunit gamma and tau [Acidihalobacter yilgarnensis]|uniref:DNA polymerase III subunit gamma/tau n=1 Tax=Acidihalobacter yilgarnensis TaxID=2819280 RepID=A0A1D8ISU8_9GAMM|nr:DNA polymerase III subunit gamma/tau [Acidihalobacter yilgarnensis]AOU99588.1 DNA polymerase III, subunit gamma and tau [Acidihalobacter yilgarnensis]
MTYQALARKWRPHNFDELVGQAHVRRALINALRDQRIHPAYLFTGTRGVGKTTLARILAKCLNCETGVTPTPCGVCSACREIDEGRFIDLIEVDAASRTKVEDTRELLENVQYAPTRGRYKVYLIDEVHMLSGHSFNALLKTLEEPPPHVQFLLATTDPQKLPATILSRCVQFGLKRIPEGAIAEQLASVLDREGLSGEPDALRDLAHAADGSLRDALSLLDQAVAYGGGTVNEADVRDMLGTISRDAVLRLLQTLAAGDAMGVLGVVDELAEQAADFASVLTDLLTALHRLAVRQFSTPVPDGADSTDGVWSDLAAALSPEDVQLYYQIALIGRRDLPLAADPRSGIEMVLLRMLAFRPGTGEMQTARGLTPPSIPTTRSPPAPVGAAEPRAEYTSTPAGREEAAARPTHTPASAPIPMVSSSAAATSTGSDTGDWAARVAALGLRGLAGQLASHTSLISADDGHYRLAIERASEHLCTEMARQRLTEALSAADGCQVRIDIQVAESVGDTPAVQAERVAASRQSEAERSIETDEWIQSIRAQLDAKVVPGSVRPHVDAPNLNDR